MARIVVNLACPVPSNISEILNPFISELDTRGLDYSGPVNMPTETHNGTEYSRSLIWFRSDNNVAHIIDTLPDSGVSINIAIDPPQSRTLIPLSELIDSNAQLGIESDERPEETHEEEFLREGGNLGKPNEMTDSSVVEPRNDLSSLRERAELDGQPEVRYDPSPASAIHYHRSAAVREYVMARANGVCEGCKEPAPFQTPDDEPYLHAHHVFELSDGGSDTPDSVIALCPNCHYAVHHGKDGEEYNQQLIKKLEGLGSYEGGNR